MECNSCWNPYSFYPAGRAPRVDTVSANGLGQPCIARRVTTVKDDLECGSLLPRGYQGEAADPTSRVCAASLESAMCNLRSRGVATVNLLLIDRGFVLHRNAHGQKGAVRGYHSGLVSSASSNIFSAAIAARSPRRLW